MSGGGGSVVVVRRLPGEVQQRGREQAAGPQVARDRCSARDALVATAEQLQELHRREHEVEPPPEVEVTRASATTAPAVHVLRGRPATSSAASAASGRGR